MKVILLNDVKKVGKKGQVVEVSFRPFESGTGAGKFQRLFFTSSVIEFIHACRNGLWILPVQTKVGFQYDPAFSGRQGTAVAKFQIRRFKGEDLSGFIHQQGALQYLTDLSAVGACVHNNAAPCSTGNPGCKFKSGKTGSAGKSGKNGEFGAGLAVHVLTGNVNFSKLIADTKHQSAKACIADQQIGAVSQYKKRNI